MQSLQQGNKDQNQLGRSALLPSLTHLGIESGIYTDMESVDHPRREIHSASIYNPLYRVWLGNFDKIAEAISQICARSYSSGVSR